MNQKHVIILFATMLLYSCNFAQNGSKHYTVFAISDIPDIKKTDHEKSPAFIKTRLEALIGKSYREQCENAGIAYPPAFFLFRFFKAESEFEIWAGNSPKDSLKLLSLLPVCAVDKEPGTKFREGDGKTPEGFYSARKLYGSSYNFMWIKLNTSEIDNFGEVNNGSSFRLCLDYPLPPDHARTMMYISASTSPGSGICIHGNCVTAGCISFKNRDFLPVFLSALYHNENAYGNIRIHSFPFRFSEKNYEKYIEHNNSLMNNAELKKFWHLLEKAYLRFEKSHRAFKIESNGSVYKFSEN